MNRIEHIQKTLIWAGTRVAVFLAIAFLIIWGSIDPVRMATKTVDFFMPESRDYLSELEKGNVDPDQKKLKANEKYFKIVNRYVAPSPFGYGMLGFISYHEGDLKKAARYYQKALGLYSYYLNYNYNLALINFQNGNPQRAADLLAQALQTGTARQDLIMIDLSRHEMEFFTSKEVLNRDYAAKWRKDYQDAVFLLLSITFYAGDKEHALQIIKQVLASEEKDDRLSCMQSYIVYSRNEASHVARDSFRQCQKRLGWSTSDAEDKISGDPFNIRRLSVKLW